MRNAELRKRFTEVSRNSQLATTLLLLNNSMPKRNLILLVVLMIVCFSCYVRADRHGRLLTHIKRLVESEYYYPGDESPITGDALFEHAAGGMLRYLDPYSNYYPPEAFNKVTETLDQRFAGIGAELAVAPSTKAIIVSALIYGSPAQKAGVLPGDHIVAIDGQTTQNETLSQVIQRLRGEPNQIVKLQVQRAGTEKPIDFEVKRAIVSTASAVGDRRLENGQWEYFLPNSDHVAYVRIIGFGFKTAKELSTLIPWLLSRGMRSLILDLRDNPGGTLASAVEMCNLFVPENELIVSIRSRKKVQNIKAEQGDKYRSFPIVILINGQTASASEIVSSCLQDSADKPAPDGTTLNVKIMGSRSFGKGAVQDMFSLPAGYGAVKFTVASYVSPNGKNIHRFPDAKPSDQWGVLPDEGFEIKMTPNEEKKLQQWRRLRSMSVDISAPGSDPPFGDPVLYDPCIKRALEWFAEPSSNNNQK